MAGYVDYVWESAPNKPSEARQAMAGRWEKEDGGKMEIISDEMLVEDLGWK